MSPSGVSSGGIAGGFKRPVMFRVFDDICVDSACFLTVYGFGIVDDRVFVVC